VGIKKDGFIHSSLVTTANNMSDVSEHRKLMQRIISYGIQGDYLRVFGLEPTTTKIDDPRTIHKRFLKLSKLIHPDKFSVDEDTVKLSTEAFKILCESKVQLLRMYFHESAAERQENPARSPPMSSPSYSHPASAPKQAAYVFYTNAYILHRPGSFYAGRRR
jgi:hypothetical protein